MSDEVPSITVVVGDGQDDAELASALRHGVQGSERLRWVEEPETADWVVALPGAAVSVGPARTIRFVPGYEHRQLSHAFTAAGDEAHLARWLVSSEEAARWLREKGIAKRRVGVIGPLAPAGFERAEDRAPLKAELELGELPVLLVTDSVVSETGLEPLLVQLSLVNDVTVLFDVGTDAELASALRAQAGYHDLRAFMFADGERAPDFWRVADLVLTLGNGAAPLRSIAVGAPMVFPPETDGHVRRALSERPLGTWVERWAMFAVTVERLLKDRLAEARSDVEALEIEGTPKRFIEQVLSGSPADSRLPIGLEALTGPEETGTHTPESGLASKEDSSDSLDSESESSGSNPRNPDADLERELEELRQRIK